MEKIESVLAGRALANQSFERWIPRQCDEKWIALVSDAPKFGWDTQAIQKGLIDPLYGEFTSQPERWRPILAANLIWEAGLDAAEFSPLLAAIELCYLSFVTIRNLRNSLTAAEALPNQGTVSFPILVTVSYTARQLALTLVFSHAGMLRPDSRSWLGYRFGRVLIQMGVGGAVDMLKAEKGMKSDGERRYLDHLKLAVSPLTFTIAADTAIAAIGLIGTPEGDQLQQAASHLGIAYNLVTEILLLKERRNPSGKAFQDLLPHWSYAAAMGCCAEGGIRRVSASNGPALEKEGDLSEGRMQKALIQKALTAARKQMDQMEFSLKNVRKGLAGAYESFSETAVLPKIRALEEGMDA